MYSKRGSYREVFNKKDVFENFSKFTRKHLCQNLPVIFAIFLGTPQVAPTVNIR